MTQIMPDLTNVLQVFESDLTGRIMESKSPVCNIQCVKDLVDQWKSQGYTTVFTAGVFDLFTLNHLLALYHYKMLGGDKSKLIVSIDTDLRVKNNKAFAHNKGNCTKPILSWRSRAMMVAKQSFKNTEPLVNLIVQHGDDTCTGVRCTHDDDTSIVEYIKPDIMTVASSSTNTIKIVSKSNLLNNTKIIIIKEADLAYEDYLIGTKISTTSIINRIKNNHAIPN